jgi:hypothetical protein
MRKTSCNGEKQTKSVIMNASTQGDSDIHRELTSVERRDSSVSTVAGSDDHGIVP